ncbi:MAG TPA: protein arginine kinase [Tissierellaceae bacterium]|nr:protein arginine kinase [Tissierellaceae bacterium]
MTIWLDPQEYDQVVVSTRLRVARNIREEVFPLYSTRDQAMETAQEIIAAVEDQFPDGDYRLYRLNEMENRERVRFMENHIISPGLLDHIDKGSFFMRDDERVTIMINEEDHIRLQTLLPGLDLVGGWELCSQIDDMLEDKLDFAYHTEYGYLTACPTNTGTGLRASVMLHLPGVTMTGHIGSIINALRKIGLTIRGLYGEGTEAVGDLYQVSNQLTLGESEEEIIEKLHRVVQQLIKREKSTRAYFMEKKETELEDKVYRSLGILRSARILSSKEAMKHISMVKLGSDIGILKDFRGSDLVRLMIWIKPGNVQVSEKRAMDKKERDKVRADLTREYFK